MWLEPRPARQWVDHCIFKDMTQRWNLFCYGGCVCAIKVRLEVLFCHFANGRGSIYVAMESVVIDGCSFDSCISSSDTVALSLEGVRADSNSFSVVISKCICWNCSSYCHVFKVQYQDADVYNCAFDSCGACLNLWSVMNGWASNCSLDGCHGQWDCFGIHVFIGDRGHFAVDTCSFSNCSSDWDHVALCFSNGYAGTLQVDSSNFTYCSCGISGEALEMTHSLGTFSLLTYTNCKCENWFTGTNRSLCIFSTKTLKALLFENNSFSCCACQCQVYSVVLLKLVYSINEFKLSNCVFSGNSNFGV